LLILFSLALGQASAAPTIIFESPTPWNTPLIAQNFIFLNTTISGTAPVSGFFDWNGTLAAHITMDSYNSTGVLDTGPKGVYGAFVGANFGTANITAGGPSGKYIDFGNKTGSQLRYLDFGDRDSYSIGPKGLTVAFWVAVNNFSFKGDDTGYCNYINKAIWDSPNQGEWQFRVYNETPISDDAGRRRRMSMYVFNSTIGIGVGSYVQDVNFAEGEWIYLVGTFNGTHTKMYKNGVLRDTDLYSKGNSLYIVPKNTNAPLYIGRGEADDLQCPVKIDGFTIVDRVWSDQEIKAAMNSQSSRLYNNFTALSIGSSYTFGAYAVDSTGASSYNRTYTVTLTTPGNVTTTTTSIPTTTSSAPTTTVPTTTSSVATTTVPTTSSSVATTTVPTTTSSVATTTVPTTTSSAPTTSTTVPTTTTKPSTTTTSSVPTTTSSVATTTSAPTTTTSVPACSCTSFTNVSCGGDGCPSNYMYQVRTCAPAGCFSETACTLFSACATTTTTSIPTTTSSVATTTSSAPTTTSSVPACTCSNFANVACGAGNCSASYMYQTRTCYPAGCYGEQTCTALPECAPTTTTSSVQTTMTTAATTTTTTIPTSTSSASSTTTASSVPPTTSSVPACVCSNFANVGCGAGNCSASYMYQTRTCYPAGCYGEQTCTALPECAPTTTISATTTVSSSGGGVPGQIIKTTTTTTTANKTITTSTKFTTITTSSVPVPEMERPEKASVNFEGEEARGSWNEIAPGKRYEMDLSGTGAPIERIDFTSREPSRDAKIAVRAEKAIVNLSAHVYQYLSFGTGNISESGFSDLKIYFQVPRSWLSSNRIRSDSVSLYRYSDSWRKLPTSLLNEDEASARYEAVSPGMSYFAIASEQQVSVTSTIAHTFQIGGISNLESDKEVLPRDLVLAFCFVSLCLFVGGYYMNKRERAKTRKILLQQTLQWDAPPKAP
jgi:PGF-pre-PGF domain-containing protein